MQYFVGFQHQFDNPIDSTVTPDAAFFKAKDLSQKTPGIAFYVYNREGHKKEYTVRAFALNGMAKWSKQCTACDGRGNLSYQTCSPCHGVGHV